MFIVYVLFINIIKMFIDCWNFLYHQYSCIKEFHNFLECGITNIYLILDKLTVRIAIQSFACTGNWNQIQQEKNKGPQTLFICTYST